MVLGQGERLCRDNRKSKEEIKMLEWTKETRENTEKRMEFHLQKLDEGIKLLEECGLDTVAKKLRDAHKMIVKDLNERWAPSDTQNIAVVVVREKRKDSGDKDTEMAEDILKDLEKLAKRNSRVGEI